MDIAQIRSAEDVEISEVASFREERIERAARLKFPSSSFNLNALWIRLAVLGLELRSVSFDELAQFVGML